MKARDVDLKEEMVN